MAARFSAMSSRSAARDLEERSDGESTQESLLLLDDDRRERALRPVGDDDRYGNLPAAAIISLFSVDHRKTNMFSFTSNLTNTQNSTCTKG